MQGTVPCFYIDMNEGKNEIEKKMEPETVFQDFTHVRMSEFWRGKFIFKNWNFFDSIRIVYN